MKLQFFCPLWGSEHLTFSDFAAKAKSAGYDGVEFGVPEDARERREMLTILDGEGLELICQHWQTQDADFSLHKTNFERFLNVQAAAQPLMINSQTGKDYYR